MRHAPAMLGGVPLRAPLHRFLLFVAAVWTLGVMVPSVGMAQSGAAQATRARLSMPQQKTLSEEELKALRQKAEQGDATAQYNLGLMYFNGQGVPQDYTQAAAWYRKAADQGDAAAQFHLGVLCRDGHGVSQDSVEAYKWLSLATTLALDSWGHDWEECGKAMNALALHMTDNQIAEARKRASEWTAAFEKRKK